MAKPHKTCMEQAKIIDTFGTYQTAGQADTTMVLVLARAREIPCSTKVELYQEHTRDKVKRWFTLLVTARVGGMTRHAPTLLVVLAAVVVRDSPGKGQR